MMNLLDIIRPSRSKKPKLDFVPVIFADGIDDDAPGLVAALSNDRVQYGEKIYARNEDLVIDHAHLLLKVASFTIRDGKGASLVIQSSGNVGPHVSVVSAAGRLVTISNSIIQA